MITVFRLSSLGDVVLASAALEIFKQRGEKVHWVTASDVAPLLVGHPTIEKLWVFDRNSGFRGWVRLLSELARTVARSPGPGPSKFYDLHGSLRTRFAGFLFRWFWRRTFLKEVSIEWVNAPKERLRLWALCILGPRLLPKGFRRTHRAELFAQTVLGSRIRGSVRPDLSHLLARDVRSNGISARLEGAPYFCVMPAAKGRSKEWPTERFADVIKTLGAQRPEWQVVVLGGAQDLASKRLVSLLTDAGIPHLSGVGVLSLSECAQVLSRARFLLSNDTGISHLAEAVGTRTSVIFGPTTPELGFGPVGPESSAIGVPLGCRPCGRDGRWCHRPVRRHLCLTRLSSDAVVERLLQ